MKLYSVFQTLFSASYRGSSLYILILLSALSGFLDAVGVFSVMPFVAAVSNPDLIAQNDYLLPILAMFNLKGDYEIILFFGLLVMLAFLIGAIIKLILVYHQTSFIHTLELLISQESLQSILSNGVEFLSQKGKSSLSRVVFSDSEQMVKYVFYPFVLIISNFFILIFVASSLFIVQGPSLMPPLFILISLYLLVFVLGRNLTKRYGYDRENANVERFRLVDDISIFYENILIESAEEGWLRKFTSAQKKYLNTKIGLDIFNNTPRFVIELIIVLTGVSMILVNYEQHDGNLLSPVMMSFLIVAAYKLIPSLQMFYKNINSINYGYEILKNHSAVRGFNRLEEKRIFLDTGLACLIRLDAVNFSYGYKKLLKNIELKIDKNCLTVLMGESGSGKSTLIQLLLGLVAPTKGRVLVSTELGLTPNFYVGSISYVPQDSPLVSGSIRDIIIANNEFNNKKLSYILSLVGLSSDFDRKKISLSTVLKDRGEGLSGGQRQRIALARALYNESKLIILDEPTSALDLDNSNRVKDLINRLSQEVAVVVISHDHDFIDIADKFYQIKNYTLFRQK